MIAPVIYEKNSADSPGIEAYLETRKDVEKCDASKSTHPLMRFSYVLFHSSNAYKLLQIYGGAKGVKRTARAFFEEVGMLDRLKDRGTIGALKFKAKNDSEQTQQIKNILYTDEYRPKGPNEDLKGAWVIKSINLEDPEDISVKIYDIDHHFGEDGFLIPEEKREVTVSDIGSRIEQFKKNYESAVDTGNLVVAYQIGGDAEYITAPDLQEKINNGFQTSFSILSNAIDLDREISIRELKAIKKQQEEKNKIEESIKKFFSGIGEQVAKYYPELNPPEEVEELEPVS